MKLASYNDGSRDGQLVVVSRDLTAAHYATGIATRLQQVLDDWNFLSPQLQALSQNLNHGKSRHPFAFDPTQCLSPLPRAFQWIDGPGFADQPAAATATDIAPPMHRGASDSFLSPRDEFVADEALSVDIEARLAVVVGDVERGITPESALESVRLVMLAGEVVHRADGVLQATAFSPVAVTPDELAPGWQGGRLGFDIDLSWNGKRVGCCAAGAGMRAHFGEMIASAAARRGVAAGSIVGSGFLSGNDSPRGSSCLADKRARELAAGDAASPAFARPGNVMRIDMKGSDGQSLFGAIELRATGTASAASDDGTTLSLDSSPD